MDNNLVSNGVNLGTNPASALGNQSINQVQQETNSEYTTLADLISTFANASIGTQNLQDGSVTNEKIATLEFGKAFGGSITIGGNNNGNGVIKVENSANQLIIQEDNLGIHFYNSSGEEIVRIDDLGLHNYNGSGTVLTEMLAGGFFAYGASALQFKSTAGSGSTIGIIGDSSGVFLVAADNNNQIDIAGYPVNIASLSGDTAIYGDNITLNPNVGSGGYVKMYGQQFFLGGTTNTTIGLSGTTPILSVDGHTKTAIVPTSKGYRALYTNESPEVYFCDFVRGTKKRKFPKFWEFEYKLDYDPLFLETVEGEPYIIETTDKHIFQVWFHRKGYRNVRMEEKTQEQFERNNQMWNYPNQGI
jgi:hypothetical protein